jgi:hypothetical protein
VVSEVKADLPVYAYMLALRVCVGGHQSITSIMNANYCQYILQFSYIFFNLLSSLSHEIVDT